MDSAKYLIIGGGLASASAVEQLVAADPTAKGATIIISAEHTPPYHRPPLSKGYYLGKESMDDILVKPQTFYDENGIDVWYSRRARLIDPAAHVCELELNKSIKFEKALIATGSSVNRFTGPGRGLEGLHYLRTLLDSDRLKSTSEEWNEVVIIGASFIGMELASGFSQKNIKTTVLSREEQVWEKLNNPPVSDFFKRYFEQHGVQFILSDEPTGFVGAGRVNSVHTKSGLKLSTDAVVLAIGVHPNVQLAEESRLQVDNGVVVDEHLQTSKPDIFAAGDITNFYDPVFKRRRRVEHWDNAEKQGQTAGRNLAGAGEVYDAVSMFFSDVYDLTWELWGDPSEADQVIQRTTPSKESICSVYVKDDRISCIFLMGEAAGESDTAHELVKERASVQGKYDILRDGKRPLKDLQ